MFSENDGTPQPQIVGNTPFFFCMVFSLCTPRPRDFSSGTIAVLLLSNVSFLGEFVRLELSN